MRLLSLFDGTGSLTKPFRAAGWEVQSVDVDGRFGASVVQDILLWDFSEEPTPDVIFSGVPCTEYSQARTTGGPRNYALADSLVKRQWEIIRYFLDKNPSMLYWIENPAFSQIWKRDCAREFASPHVILDYCAYGSAYRKRTRFATNASHVPRPLCDPRNCVSCPNGKSHARTAQKGPCRGKDFALDRFTTDALHAYPESLCQEVFDHCQDFIWEVL
jgi:hypothetical protein